MGEIILIDINNFDLLMKMDADYMPHEYRQEIFHYTSPSGFSSILFGDPNCVTLWASRYDCLNDISEGTVADEVFTETCQTMYNNGEITKPLFELVSKLHSARKESFLLNKGEQSRFVRTDHSEYICSFSKSSDSLAMWNYYSKGAVYEGFNIGFTPVGVRDSVRRYFKTNVVNVWVYPVIYRKNKQAALVKRMLKKIQDNYESCSNESVRYIISDRLAHWRLIFKKECFAHEEEVRMIIDISSKEDAILVKHRVTSGYIVPYIELKLKKENVTAANFGPLQCSEEQKRHQQQVMENMLQMNDYTAIVGYSEIPIRY